MLSFLISFISVLFTSIPRNSYGCNITDVGRCFNAWPMWPPERKSNFWIWRWFLIRITGFLIDADDKNDSVPS